MAKNKLGLILIAFLLFIPLTSGEWFDPNFPYCRNIQVQGPTEALPDYPILVLLNDTGSMTEASLRFVNAVCNNGGTTLKHETDSFETNKAYAWIKIPTASPGLINISVYYGNPSASDIQDPNNVWDINFSAVWHMNSNLTTDSTSNQNNATNITVEGTGWVNNTNQGIVANANNFTADGAGNNGAFISIADSASLDLTGPACFEGWYKPTSLDFSPGRSIISKTKKPDGDPYVMYSLALEETDRAMLRLAAGAMTQTYSASPSITLYAWNYIAGCYNLTNLYLFINGAPSGSAVADSDAILTNNEPVTIGGSTYDTHSNDIAGTLDELRITDGIRSEAWINYTYNIIANQASFVTIGEQQQAEIPVNVYQFHYNITEQLTPGMAGLVNDTQGFDNRLIWTSSRHSDIGLFFNDSATYAIGNITGSVPYELESDGTGVSTTSVYDEIAKLVYHFQEDFLTISDSTSNSNNGTIEGQPEVLGLWHFDEGSGTNATDSSPNFNNGVITGATYTTGISNWSLAFDGNGNSVVVADAWAWIGDFSFSFWIYGNVAHSSYALSNRGTNDGFVSCYTSGSSILCYLQGEGIINLGNIVGNWNHITCSINFNNSYSCYKNGILGSTVDYNASYADYSTNDLQIGRKYDGSNYFNGSIDEVTIYNSSLTQEEITILYNTQRALLSTTEATAKIGKGINLDGIDDFVNTSANTSLDGGTKGSLMAWVNWSTIEDDDTIMQLGGGSGANTSYSIFYHTGQWKYSIADAGGSTIDDIPIQGPNKWEFVAMSWDGTTLTSCIGEQSAGFACVTTAQTANATKANGQEFFIGRSNNAGTIKYLNATIDEVRYYNDSLTATQLEEFYNNSFTGRNMNLGPILYLNISVSEPANGTKFNVTPITFNLTANATQDFNCTLRLNNTIYDSAIFTASETVNVSLQATPVNGLWDYTINCFLGFRNLTTSSKQIFVDTISPLITDDFTNNTLYFRGNLSGQFNFTDDLMLHTINISVDNESIYFNGSVDNDFFQFDLNRNISNLSIGRHDLSLYVADGHTADKLKKARAYNPKNGIWNDRIEYNIRKPYKELDIKFYLKDKERGDTWTWEVREDKIIEKLRPAKRKPKQTFIVEATQPIEIVYDKKGRFGGTWLIIGDHWKDFVLSNQPSAKITKIIHLSPYSVEVTIEGITNPSLLVFDSIGDLNIVQKFYKFYKVNMTESFDSFIIDGYDIEYNLTVDFGELEFNISSLTPETLVELNSTQNNTAQLKSFNTTEALFNATVTNPFLNTSDNFTHRWLFNLSTLTLGFLTTEPANQETLDLVIAKCNATVPFHVLNLNYSDEITGNALNISNAFQLAITDGTFNYNLTDNFNGSSNNSLCTNLDPSTLTYNWDLSGQFILSKQDYTTRVINYDEGVPLGISNNPPANVSLFLITVANSTSVTYTWLTTEFQVVDGIMRIFKCTANNTLELVESTPVISGVATANIELLTQSYAYDIIIGGRLFQDFDSYTKCHTETEVTIRIFVETALIDLSTQIGLNAIPCNLSRATNTSVAMQWQANAENSSFISGCLLTYLTHAGGTTLIEENCSSASEGFSRTINVPVSNGSVYVIIGRLDQGKLFTYCDNQITFGATDSTGGTFGVLGAFAAVLIVLGMVLIFGGDGVNRLVGAGAGLIASFILGILNFPWLTVATLLLFLIIVAAVGRTGRK